jgi:hypothetical protein
VWGGSGSGKARRHDKVVMSQFFDVVHVAIAQAPTRSTHQPISLRCARRGATPGGYGSFRALCGPHEVLTRAECEEQFQPVGAF